MIKIALCDDNPIDLLHIEELLCEYLEANNVEAKLYKYTHPDELLSDCEKNACHLYILDIIMPMLTGIEMARELRWNQKDAQIIFATSEPSYALESFEVNPINYLVKPVDKQRFFDTLDLAIKRLDVAESKSITIKTKGGYKTLYLDEIEYIEYRNHVVSFYMKNEDMISTPTLRIGFSQYLSTNIVDPRFVQSHESYVINIAMIDELAKNEALVRSGCRVPVSKARYAALSEAYLDYQLN